MNDGSRPSMEVRWSVACVMKSVIVSAVGCCWGDMHRDRRCYASGQRESRRMKVHDAWTVWGRDKWREKEKISLRRTWNINERIDEYKRRITMRGIKT
jgi:hypothetical protein